MNGFKRVLGVGFLVAAVLGGISFAPVPSMKQFDKTSGAAGPAQTSPAFTMLSPKTIGNCQP